MKNVPMFLLVAKGGAKMESIAAAVEALSTYDLEETKRALHYLVSQGEQAALEHILPLTAHPDVAIRYFAKRAVTILRKRAGLISEEVEAPAVVEENITVAEEKKAVPVTRRNFSSSRAPRRPDYFKVSIVI